MHAVTVDIMDNLATVDIMGILLDARNFGSELSRKMVPQNIAS